LEAPVPRRTILIPAASLGCAFAAAAPAVSQQQEIRLIPQNSIPWAARAGSALFQSEIHGSVQKSGLYAVQVKFPAGGKAPPHTHPDERLLNVLAGVLFFGVGTTFDEGAVKPLTAGSVVIIPPDTPHYVWARDGEVTVQEAGFGPSGTKPWPQANAPTK
jgi:quercetin dioxygenase-like cupin family protein